MTALLLLAGLVTVALDQATKQLATSRLAESRLYAVAGGAGVRRVVNERGSLVALSLPQAALAWIVAVASVASAVVLASPLTALGAAGLGLVVGGATSNLADRIGRGGVVDFIALGRWPAFNLADAAMACGLAITAWSLL